MRHGWSAGLDVMGPALGGIADLSVAVAFGVMGALKVVGAVGVRMDGLGDNVRQP